MSELDFEIEQQICSEWCWAAVGSAVCRCYDGPEAPDQRGVVDQVLGAGMGSDCDCVTNPDAACNAPMSLPSALNQLGHGRDLTGRQMSFADIQAEIDAKRPVVVQITPDEAAGANHAVSIYGYGDDRTVLFADPMHAGVKITVSYADVVAGRPTDLHGTWQSALRTRPKRGGG